METAVQLLTVLAAIIVSLAFLVAFLVLDWLVRHIPVVREILDAPSRRIIGKED